MTPRITGTIDRIVVDANWRVRRGELLVQLDPAEVRLRLQKAEAALQLSYTEIRAPIDGIVSRHGVEVGARVQPGEPLMAIVPIENVYLEANFNETQLTDVRVGQPVTIVADVYPDTVFHGHVEGLSPATGAAFSLLPPENATGNWVKVVQRVPVRIRIDEAARPDRPLRIGLSATATVETSDKSGSLLTPLAQAASARPSLTAPARSDADAARVTADASLPGSGSADPPACRAALERSVSQIAPTARRGRDLRGGTPGDRPRRAI